VVIVYGFIKRAVPEITLESATYPRLSDACVRCNYLTPDKTAATKGCGNPSSSYSGVRVEDKLVRIGEGHDESFRKTHRELAGVICFFNVIALHVRNFPHVDIHIPYIVWILAQWIAGILTLPLASEVTFCRIFGGNPNGIQVKDIIVTCGIPHHNFISAAKPPFAVISMAEAPDYTIA
jgi:hypothetical protein